MSKISNVFTMLELLSNNRKYSIKELSERLEVSKRMVRLYKEELEKAGIYIDSIKGPYGGYILNLDFKLPTRGFSLYDVQLLENSLKLLQKDQKFTFNQEYLNLIDKVRGIYQGSQKKNVNKLLNQGDNKGKYNLISNAIKNKNKVWIDFLLLDGQTIERIIHPCNLFIYNNSWYVGAFCELRSEIRHFRFERIVNYKLLDETFE